jgi:hypothetical protein
VEGFESCSLWYFFVIHVAIQLKNSFLEQKLSIPLCLSYENCKSPRRNYTKMWELLCNFHISFVWELRRGWSRRNCEWAVGDEPFSPLFFHWAFSPFPRWMGVWEGIRTFCKGGFPPPAKKVFGGWEQQQQCLPSQFLFLASLIPDRIDRRDDDSSS